MQIKISTRHGHVSEQTQARITAKVERLTRLYDRISAIEITIDLEHPESPNVDLMLSAKHKHNLVATSRSDTLLAAMDDVVEKMEQQLRKHKEKVQDRHRGPGHRQQSAPSQAGPDNV